MNILLDIPNYSKEGETSQAGKSIMDHPILYPFIQRLEGYKTALKGIHWHGYNFTVHKQIDEILDDVSEFQDTIAEVGSGLYGIMPLGFVGIPYTATDPMGCIDYIIADVMGVHFLFEA